LLARLSRIDALVIDDWAMAPLAETERRDFWGICEDPLQKPSWGGLHADEHQSNWVASEAGRVATKRLRTGYKTATKKPCFSRVEGPLRAHS